MFCAVRTQWQSGFNGPIGLVYASVYPLIDRYTDNAEDWRLMLSDIQAMELAALNAMSEKD